MRTLRAACPAASASSGSAICRLNGADSSRRLDSIRNSRSTVQVPNCGSAKPRIRLQLRSDFALSQRLPGTEFLDAETGRQKPSPKCVNAFRDKNLRNEWPEMPAERPYLTSYWKRAVCGDWMVADAVVRNPSQMGYQGKIQGKNEKSPQKFRGEAPRAQY